MVTVAQSNINLADYDPTQAKLMEEKLILVNEEDKPIGAISKKDAHSNAYFREADTPQPHRAFSVFLFNDKLELMLQQRASEKITFPGLWTNTCCSHPLDNLEEREEKDFAGIKLAGIRRMEYELGLTSMVPEDLTML